MTTPHEIILPDGWAPAIGYSNGILAKPGRTLYLAGQVGWDEQQKFHSEELAPQFEQAIKNILAILAKAGGKPEHIVKITAFCSNKPKYLAARRELGGIWKKLMGRHYPCMSMIFVSALLDDPGMIEMEATAVIPD